MYLTLTLEGLGKALYTCDFATFPYLEGGGGETGTEKTVETFRRGKRYHSFSFYILWSKNVSIQCIF